MDARVRKAVKVPSYAKEVTEFILENPLYAHYVAVPFHSIVGVQATLVAAGKKVILCNPHTFGKALDAIYMGEVHVLLTNLNLLMSGWFTRRSFSAISFAEPVACSVVL